MSETGATRTVRICFVTAFGVAAEGLSTLHAQDLEPRAYSNSPTGLSFLIAGYVYAKGTVLPDPSLPVDNAHYESHTELLAYATTLNVFGKSAKLDAIVPFTSLSGNADFLGMQRGRFVDGFADPLLRFSINFYGAPALTAAQFSSYKQNLIIGASFRIGVPLGQYDDTKALNIGSHRWSFKPELGISKAFGPLTCEFAPGVTFYTDNRDYLFGRTREQSPLLSLKGGVTYSFAPSLWLSLNASYYKGGRSTVDDVLNDDTQQGVRLGTTLAFPVTRQHSVKLFADTGWDSHRDNAFNSLGVVWQYRFGGGF